MLDQNIHSSNQLTAILAKLEANEASFDDALMLDLDGNLAETNATHIFIVKDGVVMTSTTAACPEGITRQTVLALCEHHGITSKVADIPLAEVLEADKVFCTGTMGELAPVTDIGQTRINQGKVGAMTLKLSGFYSALTKSEGVQVV